jgi:twitching motility protein PilU
MKEAMEQSLYPGSQTFEQALCRLYLDGVLSYDEAMTAADSPTNLAWLVNQNSPTTSVDPATVHEEAERRISGDFVKLEIDPEFLNRP